ncbi:MAG: hypothetical protein QOJ29_3000 [Thermoleophilaceae bacterium]|jgi:hypothetical protein|nr:hypothetical protein [Thermoleophilaceae bacterium]
MRRLQPFWLASGLFVLIASAWIAHRSNTEWDYPLDAGPPIDALIHGRIHDFLAARPIMGPLSLIFRAPFAALGQLVGHGGEANYYLDDYRFGVFACLAAAGVFGIFLARFLEQQGRGRLACAAAVVLSTVNPVSLRAVHFGHPEEVFGTALLAGAMLGAIVKRPWLAATLVALAILNKQWGVIGLPAVAVALWPLGWERLRGPVLVTVGLLVLLIAPLLIVDAQSLIDLTRRMADLRGTYTFPADIWYGIAPDLSPERAAHSLNGLRAIPDWLGLIARPLIVAASVAVPLALARRVHQDLVQRGFALLALVMLLRCALDPADNGYYHVPFLIALVAADGISGRFYATAVACVLLQIPTTFQPTAVELSHYYATWASLFAIYLAGRAAGLDWVEVIRNRGVRGPGAAPSPR